jgi:catechol 2,3-dioxygenase-like lactoylglutathione lyase family enzyme
VPSVFDHVTIRASDREASERFYDTVLPVLEIEKDYAGEWFAQWGDFSLAQPSGEKLVTRRLHIAFAASSREDVDAFHHIGVEAGYRSDGAPGLRPQYRDDYYGGFLLDPGGNSVEAVHYGDVSEAGIDHLWIRVADVSASQGFYELVAEHAGFRLRSARDDHAQFAGDGRAFSLKKGEPTEGLHMAFPAGENTAVDDFHRAMTEAGYEDNGPPGERPIYHEGYYGAFVLDPDGTNVELVNHNR